MNQTPVGRRRGPGPVPVPVPDPVPVPVSASPVVADPPGFSRTALTPLPAVSRCPIATSRSCNRSAASYARIERSSPVSVNQSVTNTASSDATIGPVSSTMMSCQCLPICALRASPYDDSIMFIEPMKARVPSTTMSLR